MTETGVDAAVLLPVGGIGLSVEEVRRLWSFVHGEIMGGTVRGHLRASLGLCPRHAWGHAVVEIELWQAGAGARAGHQPFDVAVLYEDLLELAAGSLLRAATWLHPERSRAPVETRQCHICRELAELPPPGFRLGYANADSVVLAAEANRLVHTTAWCRETRRQWASAVCQECLGGIGTDPLRLCRRHLSGKGDIPREAGIAIAGQLQEIRGRLLRLIASMTDRGAPATAAEDASWIEALGWFAGWGLPIYLAGED
jgi:hypothetical protein